MNFDLDAFMAQANDTLKSQPFGGDLSVMPDDFPKDVPVEYRKTHIALYATFFAEAGLTSDVLDARFPDLIPAVRERKITPLQLVERFQDGFLPDYVSDDVREFAHKYYWPGWKYRYDEDFDLVFLAQYQSPLFVPPGYESTWHVPAGWDQFDRIQPVVSARLAEWQQSGA